MREITLKADWYLKAVLTIIAVVLCLICLNLWTKEVGADRIVDVRIKEVYPYAYLNLLTPLPVEIKELDMFVSPLPVKVTNWP